MSEKIKTDLIKRFAEVFPSFDEALIDYLADYATLKTFKSGEVVMHPGEPILHTVLVTKGRLKLYTLGDDGEEFFMYYLEPGEACAMSLICAIKNKKTELEGIALEDTEVIRVPVQITDHLMSHYKSWYHFVTENYRKRFQELLDVLKSVAFNGMDERLYYYLIKQKNAYHKKMLPLTHEQIANDLNSSRVVISRLLKQMENEQQVKLHRNAIELLF
ncbi:MAG: Crp/Fnr family transcriptional regulator [Bacteroidia bacterium]|jgi:CRP/FNR family transcriptional regulator|nr:Crp/Fnr family transcriptional regulator [Bacteroidia bacterium]